VEAEIVAVIAAWKSAFDAGDADGLARLYAPQAVFIGGIGGVHHGPEGVRRYFSQNAGPSRVEFRDVQVQAIADGVALVSMIGAIAPPGGTPRDFRFLQTYRRDDDGWRIAGHHGSHSL
jgi:uncharacterized protein (TIGR02246 family)